MTKVVPRLTRADEEMLATSFRRTWQMPGNDLCIQFVSRRYARLAMAYLKKLARHLLAEQRR